MSDLKLVTVATTENPHIGDLEVSGSNFVLVHGVDAIVQAVEVRLRWGLGEWFLDTKQGTPWLQAILRKGVSLASVQAALGREILKVDGVLGVRRWNLSIDRTTRELTGTVDIATREGAGEVSV